jgi:hypothetical protein
MLLPMAVTAPRCYSLAETVIFDFVIEIVFFLWRQEYALVVNLL